MENKFNFISFSEFSSDPISFPWVFFCFIYLPLPGVGFHYFHSEDETAKPSTIVSSLLFSGQLSVPSGINFKSIEASVFSVERSCLKQYFQVSKRNLFFLLKLRRRTEFNSAKLLASRIRLVTSVTVVGWPESVGSKSAVSYKFYILSGTLQHFPVFC